MSLDKEETDGKDAVTFSVDELHPDPTLFPSLPLSVSLSFSRAPSIIVSIATLSPALLYGNTPSGHFVLHSIELLVFFLNVQYQGQT